MPGDDQGCTLHTHTHSLTHTQTQTHTPSWNQANVQHQKHATVTHLRCRSICRCMGSSSSSSKKLSSMPPAKKSPSSSTLPPVWRHHTVRGQAQQTITQTTLAHWCWIPSWFSCRSSSSLSSPFASSSEGSSHVAPVWQQLSHSTQTPPHTDRLSARTRVGVITGDVGATGLGVAIFSFGAALCQQHHDEKTTGRQPLLRNQCTRTPLQLLFPF